MKKKIVLKIGGSLLYDDNLALNTLFLAKFKKWLDQSKDIYSKIVVIVGGGKLSRQMQQKTQGLVQTDDDIHGIAMQVTMLNAQILKEIMDSNDKSIVVPRSLGELFELATENDDAKVVFSGGLRKGWSTDMDAAVCANAIGINRVYKLSKTDGIYDSDPEQNKDAKYIKEIKWGDYFELFGVNIKDDLAHIPNKSLPIDLVCAKYCTDRSIDFFVSGGKDIEKYSLLAEVLEEGSFVHN